MITCCGHAVNTDMPQTPTVSKLLTDEIFSGTPQPACGSRIIYDGGDRRAPAPGFGVRVTAAGARAVVLYYRIGGVERRLTIGSFPAWSVEEAREQAKRLKRDIDRRRNQDPLERRPKFVAAPS
jgi:hypothetical protein